MFVFCAGMRRAGSTLQYQLAKAIVEQSKRGVAIGWQIHQNWPQLRAQYSDNSGYIVLKTHHFIEEYTKEDCRTLYIYRDIRDVVVSLMNKYEFPFERAMQEISSILDEHYAWMDIPDIYISKYECDIFNPIWKAIQIDQYLSTNLSDIKLKAIGAQHTLANQEKYIRYFNWTEDAIDAMGVGKTMRDPETQLHRNHIHSGRVGQWRTKLTYHQVKEIEIVAGNYLREYGYIG